VSSPEKWNKIYENGNQLNDWPFSEVVGLAKKYLPARNRTARSVLEIGIGTSSSYPFWLSQGFDYYAIEQSQIAINYATNKYPMLKDQILQGDFVNDPWPETVPNVILDRASITHNSFSDIKKVIERIYSTLPKDGLFIGIDWFSDKSSAKLDLAKSQQFGELREVNFINYSTLIDLLSPFMILELKETIQSWHVSSRNEPILGTFSFVVRKVSDD